MFNRGCVQFCKSRVKVTELMSSHAITSSICCYDDFQICYKEFHIYYKEFHIYNKEFHITRSSICYYNEAYVCSISPTSYTRLYVCLATSSKFYELDIDGV